MNMKTNMKKMCESGAIWLKDGKKIMLNVVLTPNRSGAVNINCNLC